MRSDQDRTVKSALFIIYTVALFGGENMKDELELQGWTETCPG